MQNEETSGGAIREDKTGGNAGGENSGENSGGAAGGGIKDVENSENIDVRTYTVKSGDTLSKIAKEFYGNANKYMDIFNANTDKLKDPNKIFPGQELVIP